MTTICGLSEKRVQTALAAVGQGDVDREQRGDAFARVAWNVLTEPGDRAAGLLVSALGAEEALRLVIDRADANTVVDRVTSRIPGAEVSSSVVEEAYQRWMPRLNADRTLSVLQHTAGVGGRLLLPDHEFWPGGLRDLQLHAPLLLWCRGEVDALRSMPRSLAMVGARASTGYGEHVTMEMAAGLVDRGIAIVSGAAYGIDGMAHRAALASDGMTLAFLAGGIDRFYPSGHDALLTRIAQQGLILAETPCGTAPTKWRFLMRNRLIAAATPATVVVEAGWRSGSLNTANHAATLGRPLGAVPGPVTSASSAGCHRLLREYDAVCVTNALEAAELLGSAEPGGSRQVAAGENLSSAALRVLDSLSARKQRTVEELAQQSGLSPRDVETGLGELDLEQRARLGDRGWRRA